MDVGHDPFKEGTLFTLKASEKRQRKSHMEAAEEVYFQPLGIGVLQWHTSFHVTSRK